MVFFDIEVDDENHTRHWRNESFGAEDKSWYDFLPKRVNLRKRKFEILHLSAYQPRDLDNESMDARQINISTGNKLKFVYY
jgi:hypothetical protein